MKKTRILLGMLCICSIVGGSYYVYIQRSRQDTEPPSLTSENDCISASIEATEEELTEGITAWDEVDGDVSDSVLIESITKTDDEDNMFEITYAAFDHSNNYGKLTEKLQYTDYQKPHFSISEPLRFAENQSVQLFDILSATDCIDGDLSPFITLEGGENLLDSPSKGIYDCTVSVTNSVGDTSILPLQIEVYEDSYEERTYRPVIYLNKYVVYLTEGSDFDAYSYIDHINDQEKYCKVTTEIPVQSAIDTETEKTADGVQTDAAAQTADAAEAQTAEQAQTEELEEEDLISVSEIQVTSNVDTSVPGVYSVVYTYTSEKTNYDCNANLIVVVE
jgi:hypothetical protein